MNSSEVMSKYPLIFQEAKLSPQETCMCWGLEVPSNWIPLIDQFCQILTEYKKSTSFSYPQGTYKFPQVIATQVKEKFHTLRFYYRLQYEEEDVPEELSEYHRGIVDGLLLFLDSRIEELKHS